MENFYLAIVIILFVLAISDLIVGVSNDAVNFLNSAVGAKAASFKVIMAIAAVGIIFGATFSSGMMEIARKGIFNPEFFNFSEIIIIFLAVMFTDVVLLDLFNTFGLPTSTTVSIVFELLGAAVAISIIKLTIAGQSLLDLGIYINSDKAMQIIGGILLSVFVAFTIGAIIQYITRLLFSFNFDKKRRIYAAVFGGIAIAAITFFILVKGAKGASFMGESTKEFIDDNKLVILGISFLAWTTILYILNWIIKLDIFKTIVLVGTFALAMAFAGNDLVNFIGVPMAGLESYKDLVASGSDPDILMMSSLKKPIATNTGYLVLAGLIMVMTLYLSKKAKSVIKTSLDLSRQTEGSERFKSTGLARGIVRGSLYLNSILTKIFPEKTKKGINRKFDQTHYNKIRSKGNDAPAFDMLRAALNLVIASILISYATSRKLPLSTTYVTFMVAMGTSLADRAWGRESAVYRITGVFSVIGGWFLTAFSAFTIAFIVAYAIFYGGIIAISIMLLLAGFFIFRTHVLHRKRVKVQSETSIIACIDEDMNEKEIFDNCSMSVANILEDTSGIYSDTLHSLNNEKLKKLHKAYKKSKDLDKQTGLLKENINNVISRIQKDSVEMGSYYILAVEQLREISHATHYIVRPSYNHVDNNHKEFTKEQKNELTALSKEVEDVLLLIVEGLKNKNFEHGEKIMTEYNESIRKLTQLRKNQIKRIKSNESGTKNSLLYLEILTETKNLLGSSINLFINTRDYISKNPV